VGDSGLLFVRLHAVHQGHAFERGPVQQLLEAFEILMRVQDELKIRGQVTTIPELAPGKLHEYLAEPVQGLALKHPEGATFLLLDDQISLYPGLV